MAASVYKLVFQDPDCKKLAASKLEMGTYTTYIVTLLDLLFSIWYIQIPNAYKK